MSSDFFAGPYSIKNKLANLLILSVKAIHVIAIFRTLSNLTILLNETQLKTQDFFCPYHSTYTGSIVRCPPSSMDTEIGFQGTMLSGLDC